MANTFNHKFIPRRVAAKYNSLTVVTSKLQKKTASIGFIRKALHNQVIPKFSIVKAKFINKNDT